MNRSNNIVSRMSSRLITLLVLALGIVTTAAAQNVIKIDAMSFKPGESKTIPVVMENSDPVSSLQMDVYLPTGIECEGVDRNAERLLREEHTVSCTYNETLGCYRVVILALNNNNVIGNEGELIYLKLKAMSDFVKAGVISINNIIGTGKESGELIDVDMDPVSVSCTPDVGILSFVEDTVSVKPEGMLKKINVNLKNDVTAYGLEAEITMPEGVSIETNAAGTCKFEYSNRLPQNATISSRNVGNGKYRIVISSLDAAAFTGNDGTLFSFNVTGPAEFPEISKAYINNAMMSDAGANAYVLDCNDSVVFVNTDLAYYLPAKKLIDSLQTELAGAVAAVDSLAPDVKDSEAIAAARNSLTETITAMSAALEEGNANETLTYVSDAMKAQVDELLAAIEKYVADAKTAQAEFVTTSANDAAYARLTAQLNALQASYNTAKTTIDTDCKDVAAQFKSTLDSIQTRITAMTDSVKSQYDAVALTAESTIDSTSVGSAIESVLAAAVEAQQKFVANKDAYARLTTQLSTLSSALDKAKTTIIVDCKDVATAFTSTLDSIQTRITAMTDSVKAQYDAVALTAESTIDSTGIAMAIDGVLAEAKAAQAAYEGNADAYIALNAAIEAVADELDAAKTTINTEYSDVADQFADALAAIDARIVALTDSVKAEYEAGNLTAESTVDTESLSASVKAVVADAEAAQKAYDDKKAANEAAYERLNAQLSEVQDKLDAAEKKISEEYEVVAAQFASQIDSIQGNIDALTESVRAQYEAMELNDESTVDTKSIETAIEEMLKEAEEAFIASGIDGVSADGNADVRIFTLSGTEVEAPVKGQVNIFRYSDGTVKKQYIK